MKKRENGIVDRIRSTERSLSSSANRLGPSSQTKTGHSTTIMKRGLHCIYNNTFLNFCRAGHVCSSEGLSEGRPPGSLTGTGAIVVDPSAECVVGAL